MTVKQEMCRLEISALVRKETELTMQFEELLADEYRVITERDITSLEQLISDKARLLEQLGGLEQERARILGAAGFGTGTAGMTDCLRWCDPQGQLDRPWRGLQAQARTCHDLNRRNQQLVDLCSRHTREVLHLLRGEEPDQNTYQADGEAGHRHSSRSLAKV